jgi:uncharacterized membrane protein
MPVQKREIIILLIILVSILASIYAYPRVPEQMASHWNAAGQINGYMPRLVGLALMPVISIGAFLLFLVIPRIDPLRRNIAKFRKYFDGFIVLMMLFLLYLHGILILANIGFTFNMIQVIAPALGVVFYYCGVLIGHAKKNWSIGIRTPWTLSSERVWNETHKRGSKLFKAAGIIAFLGIVLPDYAIIFVLAPVIASIVYTFVYSYVLYQKKRR